eukprot:1683507-Rhodomonas_salina.2
MQSTPHSDSGTKLGIQYCSTRSTERGCGQANREFRRKAKEDWASRVDQVLPYRMVLCDMRYCHSVMWYAICGTAMGERYCASVWRYAICGTAMGERYCDSVWWYALSGTAIAYGGMR